MDNYPDGTSARDPRAPWNAPCTDHAEGLALMQVLGNDVELTTETLGEFLATVAEERQPLIVKTSVLVGPISTAELLKLMLDRRNTDAVIAAATRELASRYLDDAYTRKVIDSEMERVLGVSA